MFTEERNAVSKEMESFLDSFKKQSDAVAMRNQQMPESYKQELEAEMVQAKRIHDENVATSKPTPKKTSKKAQAAQQPAVKPES